MERETIGYGIMIVLAVAGIALAFCLWHFSYRRSDRRSERQENAAYRKLMAEQRAAGDVGARS